MNRTYLLATRSHGKLRELRELFAEHGISVIDLTDAGIPEASDEASIESWDTFEENALAKAQHFHHLTGLPTFADDSGLVVDALGGRPGVRSKRWSGRSDLTGFALDTANNFALVAELRRRSAFPASGAYICAAAFADDDTTLVRTGRTSGVVIAEPRGSDGFGYDPYFLSDDLGRTFGEASSEDKLRVSHRGRAFRSLLDVLRGGETSPLHGGPDLD